MRPLDPACPQRRQSIRVPGSYPPPAFPDARLTLIDSLDTFVVLGNISGFHDAVLQTIEEVDFDVDQTVSVFETNIRGLGGLLSAHFFAEEVRTLAPRSHATSRLILMQMAS